MENVLGLAHKLRVYPMHPGLTIYMSRSLSLAFKNLVFATLAKRGLTLILDRDYRGVVIQNKTYNTTLLHFQMCKHGMYEPYVSGQVTLLILSCKHFVIAADPLQFQS